MKRSKGNRTYYLNYDEDNKIFSFIGYVKIRSKKKIGLLKSTREKTDEINFCNIEELKNKKVSENHLTIITDMLKDFEYE